MIRFRLPLLLLTFPLTVPAQGVRSDTTARRPVAPPAAPAAPAAAQRRWYERYTLRGYAQLRYNRLLESNPKYNCSQCDRSIGNAGGIFLRRGRLILSGDASDRVSIYVQPDFGSDAAGTLHYLQLRDAYFDLWLDAPKLNRVRVGQSKIPWGFENLQSSSNRLPLDRNDALNSAIPNERDIGVFYYWNNRVARDRFKMLTDSGLKGSGDYGVFGLGVYNGQTANRPEANNSLHGVARVSYPMKLARGQMAEAGVQYYRGRFVLPSRTASVKATPEYLDERWAGSFTLYQRPVGLVAEWTQGWGPEFDPATKSVLSRRLEGGYVQPMVRFKRGTQVFTAFGRAQYYRGGKKLDVDARRYRVHETEVGLEWLPFPSFELTTTFVNGSRETADGVTALNTQKGRFLRLQAQFNY